MVQTPWHYLLEQLYGVRFRYETTVSETHYRIRQTTVVTCRVLGWLLVFTPAERQQS